MFEISFALALTETGYPRRKARSRRSAFARFTRYSASDIAPAIATAVAPSREKIFWTTFDPTKNPFEARLSAARTTPSLLRMPTVVVMLNLGPLCGRSGMLTRIPPPWSHRRGLFLDRLPQRLKINSRLVQHILNRSGVDEESEAR